MPAEVATVVDFLEGGSPDYPDEKLWPSHYRIQTTEYAFRKNVECIDDGPLRVGAKVHLIENGEYFNADLNKSNPALAKSLDHVFVVKEICSKMQRRTVWVCGARALLEHHAQADCTTPRHVPWLQMLP